MSHALPALLRRVRIRAALNAVWPLLPWLLALMLLAAVQGGLRWNALLWGGLTVLLVWRGWGLARSLQRLDRAWMARALDAARIDLEDSSDLLDADPQRLSAVQTLQRQRVLQRLAAHPLPELRRPLPWRGTALSCVLATMAAAWPLLPRPEAGTATPAVEQGTPPAAVEQSLQVQLHVVPPPYTGRAERQLEQLNAQVEQNSRLRWSLQFALPPSSAQLHFVDGSVLELEPRDGRFEAERTFAESTLYRLQIQGAPAADDGGLYRIDAETDRPPQISVIKPERTLTIIDAAERQWSMEFLVEDDYGLGRAELTLTLAQGSGEQVTVVERRLPLTGEGEATKQRFRRPLDLNALGFAQGDDLIVRLEILDNRAPQAQLARSPALILRWPDRPSAEGSGVEGLVQRTLPAYFRSQRQIIIDTEALIAERAAIGSDALLSRSDALGVDQRILRLRYGQFLGEESEAGNLPGSGPADADESDAHHEDDGHDHDHEGNSADSSTGFGETGSLIAEVGHLHDMAEAATLLDPRTRSLLRAALGEMWQAEGQLRLGKPEVALPFEYRALDLIKQVQQANRIYLARVGLELPAVDFSRRLSGEDRPRSLAQDRMLAARNTPAPLADWWQALQSSDHLPLDALADWLSNAPGSLPDPLGAMAELDALRRDPACLACRQRLQQQLWPALPMPAAAPKRRSDGGAAGSAYLSQLEQGQ
ncbi:hypothetical protein [Pseudomarimonas arenosa]|uniref:DUF4175 domain-containing protein n=1 Tax=Pseudomarimonas arenosa TaxID=2774145 RepID=A0AAW3ZIV5_9GAMM|nr:hypothetical protein [Pseudomarimonas arenosa]MBD8525365.1 hypothetical protein [Pseudomarimonas arenosa]